MKYVVCRWEENGYHDSYFYAAVWDTETREQTEIPEGATAWGGWHKQELPLLNYSPEALAQWREWAISRASEMIHEADRKEALEPDSAPIGSDLVLTRDCRHRGEPTTPKGSIGRVFWAKAYGTFYRNGYNRPGRDNIRVGLELTNGDRVFVPLSACRQNREPEPLQAIAERLRETGVNPAPLTTCRAWLSDDYTTVKRAAVSA